MQNQKVTFGALTGWKNYPRYRMLLHVLVWVGYILAFAFIYSSFYESVKLGKALAQFSATGWIDAAAAYLLIYFLIPEFLLKKKYKEFLLWFISTAVVFILLQRVVVVFFTFRVIYPDSNFSEPFFRYNFLYSFLNIYVMPAIFASVKLFEYWYANQKRNQELMQEKLESELKFLKSQIHPHFLFNTLNNLYALTLDKSEKAPEVVVKLSGLLSYMLYECNVPRVPLDKEITILNDYLELEKIRYQRELKSKLDVIGRINGKMIAPLLLLPFVENAFKHGLSKDIRNPWISIAVNLEDLNLVFKVENSKPETETTDEFGYTEGIGLKNVRRRLELIYADNYELNIWNEEKTFTIELVLTLQYQSKPEAK